MTIYLKKGLFPSCFVWQYCLKCQRGLFVHFQINSEFWRNVAAHFVNLGFYANCDIQIHITLLFGHSGIYLSLTYKIEMLQFYSGPAQQENSLEYCRTTRFSIQNTKQSQVLQDNIWVLQIFWLQTTTDTCFRLCPPTQASRLLVFESTNLISDHTGQIGGMDGIGLDHRVGWGKEHLTEARRQISKEVYVVHLCCLLCCHRR